MVSDRLIWGFGAAFLCFGLPLFFVEDPAWVRPLISLCVLSLGGFALSMAAEGLAKGVIRFQFSRFSRTAQPVAFWASFLLVSAAGMGAVATAIWAYFIKVWP